MKTKTIFQLAFFATALVDIFFVTNHSEYRMFSKPLLMITLILYFLSSISFRPQGHTIFILALIFAFLGDTFLLGDGQQAFTLGLGSFLIMQILYAFIFLGQKAPWTKMHLLILVLLMIFCGVQNMIVLPHVGAMKIPVIIYGVAIGVMVYLGLIRKPSLASYLWIVFGVLFFLISDSLLAYNKFVQPVAWGGLGVMVTYIVAQYLIVEGYLKDIIEADIH